MIGLSGHWLSYIRGMERRKGDSGDCYSFLMCIFVKRLSGILICLSLCFVMEILETLPEKE